MYQFTQNFLTKIAPIFKTLCFFIFFLVGPSGSPVASTQTSDETTQGSSSYPPETEKSLKSFGIGKAAEILENFLNFANIDNDVNTLLTEPDSPLPPFLRDFSFWQQRHQTFLEEQRSKNPIENLEEDSFIPFLKECGEEFFKTPTSHNESSFKYHLIVFLFFKKTTPAVRGLFWTLLQKKGLHIENYALLKPLLEMWSVENQFFPKHITGFERFWMIHALLDLTLDQQASVRKFIVPLLPEDMCGGYRASILEAVKQLSLEEIQARAKRISELPENLRTVHVFTTYLRMTPEAISTLRDMVAARQMADAMGSANEKEST